MLPNSESTIKGQILVIDPSSDWKQTHSGLFQTIPDNWHIHHVNNGPEALALFKTQNINAVLSDLLIPGLDGVELIKSYYYFNRGGYFCFCSYYDLTFLRKIIPSHLTYDFFQKPLSPVLAGGLYSKILTGINEPSTQFKPESKTEENKIQNVLDQIKAEIPGVITAFLFDSRTQTNYSAKSGITVLHQDVLLKQFGKAMKVIKENAFESDNKDEDTEWITSSTHLSVYVRTLLKGRFLIVLVTDKNNTNLNIIRLVIQRYLKQ